jgi:adenine deaminase
MTLAANAVLEMGGGIAVVHGERVAARLPLPVGGLMSTRPLAEVVQAARAVRAALHAWGYRHANAFMSVSTLSLPVSPKLKLTDKGLVDVERRAWADETIQYR